MCVAHLWVAVVEVVKEDAPQAAALPPVLDEEVLVAPRAEALVEGGVVAVAHLGPVGHWCVGVRGSMASLACGSVGTHDTAGATTQQQVLVRCAVENGVLNTDAAPEGTGRQGQHGAAGALPMRIASCEMQLTLRLCDPLPQVLAASHASARLHVLPGLCTR